jgi:autotransporter adhesin
VTIGQLATSASSGISVAQSGVASLSTGLSTNASAVGALDAQVNGGAGVKYSHANSSLGDSIATGLNAVAIGPVATAAGDNAIAIGNGATAGGRNDVALGAGATTAPASSPSGIVLGGVSYGYAGGAPVGTVSVGASGATRTITHVAAGQVSATSTDAVNGSQLYAADQAISGLQASSSGGAVAADNQIAAQAPVASGVAAVAVGYGAMAAAANSTVIGAGASDNGNAGATVIGQGAGVAPSLAGANIALGQGATVTAAAVATSGATIGATVYSGFAGASPAGTLSIGAAGAERTITNVAAGQITAGSTDAVNGAELYAVASTSQSGVASLSTGLSVAQSGVTSLSTGLSTASSGVSALNAELGAAGINYLRANSTLSGATAAGVNSVAIGPEAVAAHAGDVALGYGSSTAAAVATTGVTLRGTAYAYAGASPSSTVSIGAPGAERTLTNLAAGQVSATSTDAVNGSELYAADQAIGALVAGASGGVVSDNAGGGAAPSATGAGSLVGGVGASDHGVAGSTVLGSGASVSAGVTGSNVALGQNSVVAAPAVGVSSATIGGIVYGGFAGANPMGVVSVGAAGQSRVITNVAAGRITAVSTDAVNGSELFSVTNQVSETANTVALALGGGATGLTAGVSNPNYMVFGQAMTSVGQAIAGLQNHAPVQFVSASGAMNTPANGPTNTMALMGATGAGAVTLENVAAGTALSDAVNLQQLENATVHGVSVNMGAAAPGPADTGAYSVAVGASASAGGAGDVAVGEAAMASGDAAGAAVSVGMGNSASGAGAVAIGDPNISSGTGAVTLGANNMATGDGAVALGNISTAQGNGAVALGDAAIANGAGGAALGNGAQALGASAIALGNQAIATSPGDVALGAGSVTGAATPTASVTVRGVAYAVAGANPTSVVSVGSPGAERQITNIAAGQVTATSTDAVNGSELYATNQAVGAIGGAVSTVSAQAASANAAVAALSSGVSNGLVGLVQQQGGAPGNGEITVGAQTGGTFVNLAGTAGARAITGLAPGVDADDAVTVGQLQAMVGGATANAVQYDGASHLLVTLGGPGATIPVALDNVAAGAVTATSTAAVNGAQLYATNVNVANLQNGAAGPFQVYQTGAVTAPMASGLQATAGGDGALASGGASTAIGYRASASGVNSVALGAGSSDGGQAGVVSVGSPGNERRITNLAPGQAGTDAVNMNQLGAVANYATALNSALSLKVDDELASANALSSLAFATVPGKGMLSAGFGFQQGQGAFAVGFSHQFNDRYNTIIRAGGAFGVGNAYNGGNVSVNFQF